MSILYKSDRHVRFVLFRKNSFGGGPICAQGYIAQARMLHRISLRLEMLNHAAELAVRYIKCCINFQSQHVSPLKELLPPTNTSAGRHYKYEPLYFVSDDKFVTDLAGSFFLICNNSKLHIYRPRT